MRAMNSSKSRVAIRWVAAGLLLASLPSCRSASEEAELIDARPGHAVCAVCRCDGDLGCMDVVIGPQTPHAEFGGRTYYFCSDSCRTAFERDPRAYAGG
jgi:YHS domain